MISIEFGAIASNQSDKINCALDTLYFFRFFFKISLTVMNLSTNTIFHSGLSIARDIPMQPLPVPKSIIVNLLDLLKH